MKNEFHWLLLGFALVVAATLGRAALRGWLNVSV